MDLTSLAGTLLKLGGTVIGTALGGPAGAAIAGTVVGELARQFGTEATPEAVQAAIKADPDAAAKIQAVESARAAAVLAELNVRLADVQDARATMVRLAEAQSLMAWGAALVSLFVLGTFAVVMSYAIIRGIPAGSEGVLMSGLIETLKLMSVSVVSYWVGSSAGSASKDAALKQLAAGR